MINLILSSRLKDTWGAAPHRGQIEGQFPFVEKRASTVLQDADRSIATEQKWYEIRK